MGLTNSSGGMPPAEITVSMLNRIILEKDIRLIKRQDLHAQVVPEDDPADKPDELPGNQPETGGIRLPRAAPGDWSPCRRPGHQSSDRD